MRIVELQIKSGQLKRPKPIDTCAPAATASRSVLRSTPRQNRRARSSPTGNDQVIAFAARAASGARYTTRDVDFSEDQGEATLTWSGTRVMCKPAN